MRTKRMLRIGCRSDYFVCLITKLRFHNSRVKAIMLTFSFFISLSKLFLRTFLILEF